MSNIQDYIAWRGDLSFKQSEFCDADSLVMCRLAYFKLDGFVTGEMDPDRGVSVSRAARNFFAHYPDGTDKEGRRRMKEEDVALLKAMAQSERYKNMTLWGYRNRFEPEEEKQFCAICALVGDGEVYVAYRGTDSTLAGWKEDFNMAFLPVIPSQKEALLYLEDAAAVTGTKNILVGGHSKGGNLAVYAAATVERSIRERIITVYNHDGPGLDERETGKPGYRAVAGRVRTFLPQSSVIGMLIRQDNDFIVVHSDSVGGIMQHNLYSWEVLGNGFVEEEGLNSSSRYIDHTAKQWLSEMSPVQRERFVDALFDILNASQAVTFKELREDKLKSVTAAARTIKNMDKETRADITVGLRLLWDAAKKTFGDRKWI